MNPYIKVREQMGPPIPEEMGPPVPKNLKPVAKPKVRPAQKRTAKKPLPPARPNPGQTQPSFPQPSVSLDPFDQGPPDMPLALQSQPAMRMGPGSKDMLSSKYGRDFARGKNLNVYQSGPEYQAHINDVMNTNLMKDLAAGADSARSMTQNFLQHAPNQVDLSPVMAFADYLAKGKGTAQAGYKAPGSYDDLVGKLSGLMKAEQGDREQIAQLAYAQTGGLKKGAEEAQTKASSDLERVQGYEIPQPRSAFPGGNPLNQALAVQRAFQGLPTYKDAEQTIASAEGMLETLRNPSWISDHALRGQMVQGMRLSPISQQEMAEFGVGSKELLNRVKNMIGTVSSGRSLTPQDYKAIEEFAHAKAAYGRKKMEMVQTKFSEGLGPYSPMIDQKGILGITNSSISPEMKGPRQQEQSDSDAKFDKLIDKFMGK